MDDAALALRHGIGQRGFYRRVIGAVAGARVADLGDGILAVLTPRVPDHSVANGVVYPDGAPVTERLGEIAGLFRAAGVRTWTAWVRPGDMRTARALAEAGHALDSRPMAMGAVLADLDLDPGATQALAIEDGARWRDVGAVNDAAYGLPGVLESLLAGCTDETARRWVARAGESAVGTAVATVEDTDVYVALVAVVPAWRRRGVATALVRRVLAAAREEGCLTTTLEASALGEPVYAALGYRPLGRLEMWERRGISA